MTPLLVPFTGFVPTADFAHRIVGPPSSMLTEQQKEASRDDELSFRNRVGRGASAPLETAMRWLERCHELHALRPIDESVIVHSTTRGDVTAIGLIADVSLAAYDDGLVKKHEATIAKTERKMVDYMGSTRVFGNPVALAHRSKADVASTLAQHSQGDADITFDAADGSRHSLWIVGGGDAVALCESFTDELYITDGHHRLAGAATLARTEGRTDAHIPAGLFAEDELVVWAFSRAITDASVDAASVRDALATAFALDESEERVPRPTSPGQIGVRLDGQSYLLTIPPAQMPADRYARLDVNLLQTLILEPLFGVTDARTDNRLSFVADTGDEAHDVDGFDAWFLPYATSVDDVMTVADMGNTMPPKSTFFLPKMPSGLVIRPVDS